MDAKQITDDFLKRIEQSRSWVESSDAQVLEVKFRKRSWLLAPVEFLDDRKRVEQHGLAFLMSLDDPAQKLSVRICVRLRPVPFLDSDHPETPYVVVYVFNQVKQLEEEVTHAYMPDWNFYSRFAGLTVQDWYLKWINQALNSQKSGKVLQMEMRLSHD